MVDLSVIIISFQDRKILWQCLSSIGKETKDIKYEVIVVDNASTDGSVAFVKSQISKSKLQTVKFIANKKNLGFARANNQGIKIARGRYILLLNQDTIILNGALQKMVGWMDNSLQVGLVGCRLLNKDKTIQPSAGYFPNLLKIFFWASFLESLPVIGNLIRPYHIKERSFYNKLEYPDWVQGAFYLLRREAAEATGLLDENYFMYVEEIDYAFRLKKAGWRVAFAPEAEVVHLGGDTRQTRNERAVLGEYKGLKLFFQKHKPVREMLFLGLLLVYGAGLRMIIFGKIMRSGYLKAIYEEAFRVARRRKRKNSNRLMKRDFIVLMVLLFLALGLRLYKINAPIADWHSWRQADTSAVTRNFIKSGKLDVLRPRYDDLSNVASGKDNPQGYRFVEFPIYNVFSVLVYKLVGRVELAGRLVSVLSSLASLVFLYLIVKYFSGRLTAALAGFIFAVLPFNIYYSRVILPEPMMVMASLGALYFAASGLGSKNYHYIYNDSESKKGRRELGMSCLLMAAAVLLKPYAVFFFLPIVYFWVKNRGLSLKTLAELGLFGGLTLLPFAGWRVWMRQFPEGIPASLWLLNGNGIRFKGAWWQWLFGDRIGRLILGYWGILFLSLGLALKPKAKEGWFYYLWGLAMFLYLAVFATGNVQHDYYQIILAPILAIFAAKGIVFLWEPPATIGKGAARFLVVVCLVFALAFGWYHIRGYYNINRPEIVAAGQAIDRLAPKEAKVIAPYGGDTAFLYQTNRQGWPVVTESIDNLIKKGAAYYASLDKGAVEPEVLERAEIIEETEVYTIFKFSP